MPGRFRRDNASTKHRSCLAFQTDVSHPSTYWASRESSLCIALPRVPTCGADSPQIVGPLSWNRIWCWKFRAQEGATTDPFGSKRIEDALGGYIELVFETKLNFTSRRLGDELPRCPVLIALTKQFKFHEIDKDHLDGVRFPLGLNQEVRAKWPAAYHRLIGVDIPIADNSELLRDAVMKSCSLLKQFLYVFLRADFDVALHGHRQ